MNELISIGSAVKAYPDGTLGGYLVRFTGPDEPDEHGEYFTQRTDFWGPPSQAGVVFHHGFARGLGKRRIGWGRLAKNDRGIVIKAMLDPSLPANQAIYAAAKAGKLGWSSGSAPHLVERSNGEILQWPIVEASLTYTPADPKTRVLPLKAILPKSVTIAPQNLRELEEMLASENFEPSQLPIPIDALMERLSNIIAQLERILSEREPRQDNESEEREDRSDSDAGQNDWERRVQEARSNLERALVALQN